MAIELTILAFVFGQSRFTLDRLAETVPTSSRGRLHTLQSQTSPTKIPRRLHMSATAIAFYHKSHCGALACVISVTSTSVKNLGHLGFSIACQSYRSFDLIGYWK